MKHFSKIIVVIYCIFLLLSCHERPVQDKTDINYLIKHSKNNIDNLKSILLIGVWTIPDTVEERVGIKFHDDFYSIGYKGEGGEEFCKGGYTLKNMEVIIDYPNTILIENYGNDAEILKWLFPNKESVSFKYDTDYVDFYCYTCLANGEKRLRNLWIESPYGKEYKLDGVNVVKHKESKHAIVMLDNLRIRKEPSINAELVNASFIIFSTNDSFQSTVIYKNAIAHFDAVTVQKDTIDGITASWYRIDIPDDFYSNYVWVFGGYVKELSENELNDDIIMNKYRYEYYESLVKLKLMKTNPLIED
jgi:hypothetical protein